MCPIQAAFSHVLAEQGLRYPRLLLPPPPWSAATGNTTRLHLNSKGTWFL